MRFSNRAAFGWIETPAPISLRTSACSNTVTSRPRARSASAAVRPPIPPPTIAMRSEPDISFRPFLCAATADRTRLPIGCDYPRDISADTPRMRFSLCSCAGSRCASEFLDHHLPHREFLNLARHRGREALDDPDVARDLVVRDAVLAERAYAFRIEGGACPGNDPGAEFFAVFCVWHAEDLDVLNFGVPIEILLDLARIDVLAAADHHVLDPADDAAISIVVDGRQVTCMHPACRIDGLPCPRLVIPVAEHDRISPRAELPGFATRDDLTFSIDDLDLEVG